jgi:hypothetical protein
VSARAAQLRLTEEAKARRILAEHGDAKAQYQLAGMYYRGKGVPQDYAEALRWYQKAADQGNAEGEYGLAFMYREGNGVPRDYTFALGRCRQAAEQGYAKAQYALGNTYFEGKELPQDYAEADRWYRKAADQGYAQAQSSLGYMYAEGKGVPQDYSEAVGWYRKAADQGLAGGQDGLGYAYSHGKGVPQDYAMAARWYRQAAKQGDEYGRRALDSMNVALTATSKIFLPIAVLGSALLLIGSRGRIRNRQERKMTVGGLLGLLWAGLDVYGYSHFGILLSLSLVNVFYFGKGLLAGASAAMLVAFLLATSAKNVLRICGTLLIAFNLYAITHYNLSHFAACPRAFYDFNGLLIGMAVSSAILLRLEHEKPSGNQNGKDGLAPSETEPVAAGN